jgi:hypothetical protein
LEVTLHRATATVTAATLALHDDNPQHVLEDHDQKVISAWHDIPLYVMDEDTDRPTGHLNFVCEIPRCSRKKFEIATKEVGNPIKQDEKKGVLREVSAGLIERFGHAFILIHTVYTYTKGSMHVKQDEKKED